MARTAGAQNYISAEPDEPGMLETLAAMVLSFLIGVGAAIGGIGGGSFIGPTLLLIFGLDVQTAIGTSAFVIIFTGLSGTLRYAKYRRVDFRTGLIVASASVPGAFVGKTLSEMLSTPIILSIFAVVLFLSSYTVLRGKRALPVPDLMKFSITRVDANGEEVTYTISVPILLFFAFLAGVAAGLLGIGGGLVVVPLLLSFRIPPHIATATSTFVVFLNATTSGLLHLSAGHVDLQYAAVLIPGVILGAQTGAYLSGRIPRKGIRYFFSALMVVIAISLLYRTFMG